MVSLDEITPIPIQGALINQTQKTVELISLVGTYSNAPFMQ